MRDACDEGGREVGFGRADLERIERRVREREPELDESAEPRGGVYGQRGGEPRLLAERFVRAFEARAHVLVRERPRAFERRPRDVLHHARDRFATPGRSARFVRHTASSAASVRANGTFSSGVCLRNASMPSMRRKAASSFASLPARYAPRVTRSRLLS